MNRLHLGHWRMEILESTHMHGRIDMQSTSWVNPKGCFIRSGGRRWHSRFGDRHSLGR